MKIFVLTLFLVQLCLLSQTHAAYHDLWKHVITLDRNAWQDQDKSKINKHSVDSAEFARRVYLDLTGKIPTYDQLEGFIQSKEINKREKLISALLGSIGYASHFTNFFGDLLRYKNSRNSDYIKYIFRQLYDNKPYDKLVYELFTSNGSLAAKPTAAFYYRDTDTGVFDTLNASVRAFLGIRLGCAQCHNHRFDKWTQKEFYETASFLYGTTGTRINSTPSVKIAQAHLKHILEKKLISEDKIDQYMKYIILPSDGQVNYNPKNKLVYPENYRYDNAKPGDQVKPRIIFDFGPKLDTSLTDKRAAFAKWMTSKENKVFAKVMANRLWKKFNGIGLMEPVDDWKDGNEIKNVNLFNALGDIFIKVNYDLKKMIWIILNSETYQKSVDQKNKVQIDNYATQGATLRRMSGYQIYDSLLTLEYGDLDEYSQFKPDHFEFYDEIQKLAVDFIDKKMLKMLRAHSKKYGTKAGSVIDDDITKKLVHYCSKVIELKEYYDISSLSDKKLLKQDEMSQNTMASKSMMEMNTKASMHHNIPRSSDDNGRRSGGFLNTFGDKERSQPITTTNSEANMQQIMTLLNSGLIKSVTNKNSHLMKGLEQRENTADKISYLTYSIYGKAPSAKELKLYMSVLKDFNQDWTVLIKILLNSREFFFIK